MADTTSTDITERFDGASDWLSPMVVKEVRQIVRAREFLISFALSLVLGLVIALLGGTSSLQGNTTAGANIFGWLMTCLTILGLVVVPVGAFMALRNERMERTFDLIMLTTLPPRRIVIGKILAQCVKLITLFAGLTPFMAMSFLLGGIDLFTILLSLGMLFIWSVWACAACLFLSSMVRSRAMSGAMLAVMGIGYVTVLIGGGSGGIIYLFRSAMSGGPYPGYYPRSGGFWVQLFGGSSSDMWWGITATVSICLMTMTNLILLAENALALEDEDRTFALRIGLLAQFLLIAAWAVLPPLILPIGSAPSASSTFYAMSGVCGFQLLIESFFMATGRVAISRRTRLRDQPTKLFPWFTVIFRPGGGRAVAYLLMKMAILIFFAGTIAPTMKDFRWILAFCGYIAFFTALPAYAGRLIAPRRATPMHLRLACLLTFLAALILPEVAYYFAATPGAYEPYPLRHIFNPLVTLGDWDQVNDRAQWMVVSLGGVGIFAYLRLMMIARKANKPAVARAVAAHA